MAKKERALRPVYVEEDFDVICEVCGAKWDFIDDKFKCPNCGDTLNEVEIATLKEEAYTRRRKKELKSNRGKRKRVAKREKFLLKWVAYLAVFGDAFFVLYKFYPDYVNPIINFIKNFFN